MEAKDWFWDQTPSFCEFFHCKCDKPSRFCESCVTCSVLFVLICSVWILVFAHAVRLRLNQELRSVLFQKHWNWTLDFKSGPEWKGYGEMSLWFWLTCWEAQSDWLQQYRRFSICSHQNGRKIVYSMHLSTHQNSEEKGKKAL